MIRRYCGIGWFLQVPWCQLKNEYRYQVGGKIPSNLPDNLVTFLSKSLSLSYGDAGFGKCMSFCLLYLYTCQWGSKKFKWGRP